MCDGSQPRGVSKIQGPPMRFLDRLFSRCSPIDSVAGRGGSRGGMLRRRVLGGRRRGHPQIPVGGHPLGVSSNGTHLWVTNYSAAPVSEIKASSGTVIRTITVGRDPEGVSSDGTHVWVANSGEGRVSRDRSVERAPSSAGSKSEKALRALSSDGTHVSGRELRRRHGQ